MPTPNQKYFNNLINAQHKLELREKGYTIIDNFLPQDLHDNLINELDNRSTTIHYQYKDKNYSHVFKSENMNLPGENEAFIARFKTIDNRTELPYLKTLYTDYLQPVMRATTGGEAKYSMFPLAFRMDGGDGFRGHNDAFAGVIGYSFFLNKGWCWDYGGILTYVHEADKAEPIFPKSNRLLLRDEHEKRFHYLNTIEPYCPKDQYIIVGWADKEFRNESPIRGEYYDL